MNEDNNLVCSNARDIYFFNIENIKYLSEIIRVNRSRIKQNTFFIMSVQEKIKQNEVLLAIINNK